MDTDPTIRNIAPCPICGKSDYEWGSVNARHGLRYVAGGLGWIEEMFSIGEKLTARSCRECGHVALFRERSKSYRKL